MKLFKITLEHTFVVMDDDDATIESVEKSVGDIMRLHGSDIISEPSTNVMADPIQHKDDLPEGWCTGALPYSRYTAIARPDLVNLSIKEILEQNYPKPPVKDGMNRTKYVVRLRRDPEVDTYAELLTSFQSAVDAAAEITQLTADERRQTGKALTHYYIVKVNFVEKEELITTITDDTE